MARSRTETWLVSMLVGIGLIPAALLGLWGYMRATATALHADPAAVPSVTRAAPPPQRADAVERARQIVRAHLVERNIPGLSVAVGVDGDIVWAEGFGWADLESHARVAPDLRFRIGTASIALTSAAAGLLIEDGRLKLDDVIQKYVPSFPQKPWPVTVRQLMGHVAGVRNDGGDEGPLFSKQCEQPVEALPSFADRPLLFEPGTRFRYSSYGWILVSAAIEAAAGESFLTFMQERVFDPLGMRDTEADSATEPIPNRASSYFPRFAADPRYGIDPMRPLDYSCYAGASVFVSTPSDLVRFAMAVNGGKLLQPTMVDALQASQRLASEEETGYGLGWDIETVTLAGEPARWAGHDGLVLGGPAASLVTFPGRGLVVAVTSNISYADPEALAVGIAQAFAEQGRTPARR